MKYLRRGKKIYARIANILLIAYGIISIVFIVSLTRLNMLPIIYIAILGVLLAIIGVLLSFNHWNRIYSFVATYVITLFVIALLLLGIPFTQRAGQVIDDITTLQVQTDIVSVFVLYDDPAETIEDARDYQFGIAEFVDRENIDRTIERINTVLGGSINTLEFEGLVEVADALIEGYIEAIIANNSLMRIVGELEGYEWVDTNLRILKMVEQEVLVEMSALAPPRELPESFIMLLTGIDTYGSTSARARSDVNILMVVNTVNREMLLLTTPRDALVTFDLSEDIEDKLTHAGLYGVCQSINALERLYEISINYFLRLNFTGFIEIIDALGGIEVYSRYQFTVDPIRTYYEGWNHLNGIEALAFSRERMAFEAGDYQRAIHQMEVIRAVIARATSPVTLLNSFPVMEAVSESFITNMPNDQLEAIVRMHLSDLSGWNISSFSTGGTSGMGQTFSMPGHLLYTIELDEQSIKEAQKLIEETMRTD
jgi:LCP family protein required for cell wall assembly